MKHFELAHAIAAEVTESIEVAESIIEVTDAQAVYDRMLPEGVTPAIAKSVNNYNVDFLAGTGIALADASILHMNDREDISQVTGFAKLDHAEINHVITPASKDSEDTVTPAGIVSMYTVDLGDDNGVVHHMYDHVSSILVE